MKRRKIAENGGDPVGYVADRRTEPRRCRLCELFLPDVPDGAHGRVVKGELRLERIRSAAGRSYIVTATKVRIITR